MCVGGKGGGRTPWGIIMLSFNVCSLEVPPHTNITKETVYTSRYVTSKGLYREGVLRLFGRCFLLLEADI